MKETFSNEGSTTLTPELLELDAELARVGIRERASFAPELEAELSRQWTEIESEPATHGFVRPLTVGIAAALLLAVVYSPARASLTRLIASLRPSPTVVVQVEPLLPTVVLSGAVHEGFAMTESARGASSEETDARDGARVDAGALTVFEPADFTFPRVADPDALQALLEEHYPRHLQAASVGGKVRVRLWVDPNGVPSLVQVRGSSGVPDLDRAAQDAAADLDFEPARWLGYPVGTWVEFDVGFDPTAVSAEVFAQARRGKPDKEV